MFPAFPPTALTVAISLFSLAVPAIGAPAPLPAATERFKPFVAAGIAQSVASAKTMREHMAAQDLAGAQQAWLAARAGWERAEIVSDEFFPELDTAIDAWPNGKVGFHAVEARLFGAHKTDALAEADALIASLMAFGEKLRTAALTPQGLLNGTAKLAYEIGENKADGGESQFSGASLGDIRANVAGIAEVYRTVFGPALHGGDARRDAAITSSISALAATAKAPDLKSLDAAALRRHSEELALALRDAAPSLGLAAPNLGN
jgi:iron uptake system component EfeO